MMKQPTLRGVFPKLDISKPEKARTSAGKVRIRIKMLIASHKLSGMATN